MHQLLCSEQPYRGETLMHEFLWGDSNPTG